MPLDTANCLISCSELANEMDNPGLVVLDVRYDLADSEAGRRAYRAGHVPGAHYLSLGEDLSGPPLTDSGRHPLPSVAAMVACFAGVGVGAGTNVVVYDQREGSTAARCWWMLRYLGHDRVRVLDGGWSAWSNAEGASDQSIPPRPAAPSGLPIQPQVIDDRLVQIAEVPDVSLLIDSRAPARYRGESEPLDPVAGHIPGARNRFFMDNLDSQGLFRPAAELRGDFETLLGGLESSDATFYCGSGVTACHNLLAAVHAGLKMPRLYVGSWSEWCRETGRPVATGVESD